MPRVWVLPIEPFEERYTDDWFRWWPAELTAAGLDVRTVNGNLFQTAERQGGEFLDPTATWIWKGQQVAELARLWQAGEIQAGDVVLTLDIWGPATTAACYMRDTTDRDVRVVGFYHAGASDPADFLARMGMRGWALDIERGWFKGVDLVLCGSEFSRAMACRNLGLLPPGKFRVTPVGLPIHRAEIARYAQPWSERERLVVFPHRLAPEKNPEVFAGLRAAYEARYPNEHAEFVRARDLSLSKDGYYALLGSARCVVSHASQETFGIAMQEGIALGAWGVAPNALAYPEVLRAGGWCYDTLDTAVELVHDALHHEHAATWDGWHEQAIPRAAAAIRSLL